MKRERMLALERIEILAKLDGQEGAPNAARELGLVLQRVGGAWAFGRPRDTNLDFNRVMGLGLERPGSPEDAGFQVAYCRSNWVFPDPGHP